jgi:hypothetical protein
MHGLLLTGFPMVGYFAVYRRTGGAHRIATYLRKEGWDIEVLDFLLGWSLDELKEFTRSRITSKTVFVGFGGTFPIWTATLREYFEWLKKEYPTVLIIAGGQVSNLYKVTADWYVDGFGERSISALLKHITGTSTEKLKFQLWDNGRKIIKGNLDYPSFPMKDLSIRYEDRDFILEKETLVTELGRGCIFNCSFCNFPILGVTEDHTRDADNLYEELQDTYDRFGVTKYVIADETVNDYTEKLEKFAGAIKKLTFQPRMYGFARADLLVSRPQDWDIMLSMGFTGHHYGIESTNHKTLKTIGKGMHPDKLLPGLLNAKKYFQQHGSYRGQISLIAGLPYDTPASLQSTLDWCKTNWRTENTMLFPLYIPKDSQGDNSSKLTQDWSKYYKETKEDLLPKIQNRFPYLPTQYGTGAALVNHTGLSWENETWNVEDVTELVYNFYKSSEYTQINGPVLWSVGEIELAFDKPSGYFDSKTLSDIADGDTSPEGFYKILIKSNPLVKEYIVKKLNWRP